LATVVQYVDTNQSSARSAGD